MLLKKYLRKTVVLYADEVDMLRRIKRMLGFKTDSAAIRFCIHSTYRHYSSIASQ